MVRRLLAVLVAVFVAAAGATTSAAPSALQIHYLGNEGFLIEGDGRRVLVDALFGEGIPGYAAVPEPLRADLERGVDPWGGVSLALATHYHGDHFDAAAVARFLHANPEARFVSTPQACDQLAEPGPDRAALLGRCHAVLPEPGTVERLDIGGVTVDVLNLHHGRRTPPVENLGFVVHLGGTRLLHFGDTEAKMEDFAPYVDLLRGTDVALLPFWFLSSEWRADFVRDHIGPRWIVIAHTPLPSAPPTHFARWGSYGELVRVMREEFPEAILPTAPGGVLDLDP